MRASKLIISSLIIIFSCSKSSMDESRSEKNKEVIKKYFENGDLQFEIELIDSIPNGTFKEYYLGGRIKSSGKYSTGKLEGTVVTSYINGKVQSVESFADNLLHGGSIYYYDNGNIEYKGKFYDGKKVGAHYEYFKEKNEAIKSRMEYVIVGSKNFLNEKTEYDLDGNIIKQTTSLRATERNHGLILEMNGKEFEDLAVVICDYDILFNLRRPNSCDTIYSKNKHSVNIPFNIGDTIRGVAVNYEWISKNQTVSKDLYFMYPNPW